MKKAFAAYYDAFMKPVETKYITAWRKELLAHAKGEVLEIGTGTGVNFPLYPKGTSVTAVEPNPYMISKSQVRRKQAQVPITIVEGVGEKLPFPDHQFDTVVVTLVLCSVQNPKQTLGEIKRVLKQGGRVLILEHVEMEQPIFSILQNVMTPLWKHLCDGCHLNRNTEKTIQDSGFKVISKHSYLSGFAVSLVVEKNELKVL